MSILARLVVREATRAVRSENRRRIRGLERELGDYVSDSDRADLEAILDEYPDRDTAEMRDILASQQMRRLPPAAGMRAFTGTEPIRFHRRWRTGG
jgi:hypothetical protein